MEKHALASADISELQRIARKSSGAVDVHHIIVGHDIIVAGYRCRIYGSAVFTDPVCGRVETVRTFSTSGLAHDQSLSVHTQCKHRYAKQNLQTRFFHRITPLVKYFSIFSTYRKILEHTLSH